MRFVYWLGTVLLASSLGIAASRERRCSHPLGIQSGGRLHVPDINITASSSKASRFPHHGRLYGPSAWCSVGNITSSWIKVSFGERHRITAIMTQGSKKDFIWVTKYRVEYRQRGHPWITHPKELIGNSILDYPAGKLGHLQPALIAHDIRLHPLTVDGVTSGSESIDSACLRMELFGCREYDSCDSPGSVANGWHNDSNHGHGEIVRYHCNHGYRRRGPPHITCRHGKWRGKKPFCEAICPSPGSLPNGKFTLGPSTFGEVVTFSCSAGFDLVGSSKAKCVAGKWNKARPKCLARCRHPGVPTHGLIERLSLWHGGRTRFRCDLGFMLIGSQEITCLNGQWIPKPPICKEGCTDPGRPANGGRQGNNFDNGRSVVFVCLPGFTMVGPASITCKAGQWSDRAPTCRAGCSDPGIPANGMRSGDDFGHTAGVYYFCYDGYSLVGHRKALCYDGKWSSPAPTCLAGCGDPGIPKHGVRIGHDFTDLKTVRFTCNESIYDVMGSSVLRCENGTWNASTPTCKARCSPLRLPANVRTTQRISLHHSAVVVFRCHPGSTLAGSLVLMCTDGKWNGSVPICVDDDDESDHCSDPGIPLHGGRHGNKFSSGQRTTFFCNKGYTLFGLSEITCSDGDWSGDAPICRVNCKDPGVPQNGGRHGNNFSEGQRVGFFCSQDYVMDGSSEIMCVDGAWSDGIPVCKESGCAVPSSPPNSRMYSRHKSHYAENDRVYYMCDRGFYILGRRDRQCRDKTWTKPTFKCMPKGCGDPGTPKNGQKVGLIYRVLFKVYYTCLPGFRMVGPVESVCQANGTWSGTLPKCVTLQCPPLQVPQYGMKQVTMTTYLGESRFECTSRGYQLSGSKVRVCQLDGTWSGQQPTCEKVSCPDPGTPAHGSRVLYGSFRHKDSIVFSCTSGYKMTGTSRTVCLDDGTWSAAVPTCVGTKQCPLNWLEYNGRCYLFKHVTRRKQLWKRIQKRCLKHNADLLSINDRGELRFVTQHLRSSVSMYAVGRKLSGGQVTATTGCEALRSDGLPTKISCRTRLSAYICEKIK